MGRFPELTPVHRVQPSPVLGAGDITPHSEWTSSSTASIRGWANGEVAADWEVAVLPVTCGFKASKASMSVGGSKTNTAGVLKSFGEFGFSAKGVDGGIELAQLIFALAVTCNVGGKSPVTQFVRSFAQMGVAGHTPLKESKEPRTYGFSGEGRVFNGASEEFVSVRGF